MIAFFVSLRGLPFLFKGAAKGTLATQFAAERSATDKPARMDVLWFFPHELEALRAFYKTRNKKHLSVLQTLRGAKPDGSCPRKGTEAVPVMLFGKRAAPDWLGKQTPEEQAMTVAEGIMRARFNAAVTKGGSKAGLEIAKALSL